eukprot:6455011-Amphidinium_carterae.1
MVAAGCYCRHKALRILVRCLDIMGQQWHNTATEQSVGDKFKRRYLRYMIVIVCCEVAQRVSKMCAIVRCGARKLATFLQGVALFAPGLSAAGTDAHCA